MRRWILCFFCLYSFFLSDAAFGQLDCYPVIYPSDSVICKLKDEYGNNKIFFSTVEAPALVALSYFPELKDVHIVFQAKHIRTTMRAWPKPLYLFKRKKYRLYYIFTNTDTCHGVTFIERLSFPMQVALIAHELSHIIDYQKKCAIGIALMAYHYQFSQYRTSVENEADMEVINRNLGDELCDYTQRIYDDQCLTPEYKAYKHRFYFSPAELKEKVTQFRERLKEAKEKREDKREEKKEKREERRENK